MSHAQSVLKEKSFELSPVNLEGAFSRLDETDDGVFYKLDRFVSHLDTVALATVEKVIGDLVIEGRPAILDLMAGWDSHIPAGLVSSAARIVGLGLNKNELSRNKALTESVFHDVNADPRLPFPDGAFDVVLNTVSVDYMVKPFEVFQEVGRILKPGGLFLVIFSNRMFPQKAVKIWREGSEEERVILVQEFFGRSGLFNETKVFLSKGKPRPQDDKYAHTGLPSDPVYAVYAEKKGGGAGRSRPEPSVDHLSPLNREGLAERTQAVKATLACPYCGERLKKWAVPDNPFSQTWDNDYMYICFNDACPYYVRGWDHMYKGGNSGSSYRLMYNPEKDCCLPIPVPTPRALKDGIVEGGE